MMVSIGRIVKVIFLFVILLLLIKGGMILYYGVMYKRSANEDLEKKSKFDFSQIVSNNDSDQKKGGYNFKQMLGLIDACEKVKYLEHLYLSQPNQVEHIEIGTMKALNVALKQEKKRLKTFMWQLRSHSRHSVPSRRMKALKYYLRVIELNMQDIEEIIFTREESTSSSPKTVLNDDAITISREESKLKNKSK